MTCSAHDIPATLAFKNPFCTESERFWATDGFSKCSLFGQLRCSFAVGRGLRMLAQGQGTRERVDGPGVICTPMHMCLKKRLLHRLEPKSGRSRFCPPSDLAVQGCHSARFKHVRLRSELSPLRQTPPLGSGPPGRSGPLAEAPTFPSSCSEAPDCSLRLWWRGVPAPGCTGILSPRAQCSPAATLLRSPATASAGTRPAPARWEPRPRISLFSQNLTTPLVSPCDHAPS